MNFNFSNAQERRYESAYRFALDVLDQDAQARITQRGLNLELWRQAAAHGFTLGPLSDQFGGEEMGALDTALMIEALGKGSRDLGLSFSLCAHLCACVIPLSRFGSDTLKAQYLEPLVTGKLIAANAATEPEAGSDIYAMRSTAQPCDGGYRLNGKKVFITNAPIADLFVVYAKTNPDHGFMGVSAFLIEKGAPGLSVSETIPKDCLSNCPWGELTFHDLFVPETQRIGMPGAGGAIFHDSMIWEKGCLSALFIGVMERLLDTSLTYAKQRQQFGKPIGQFQSVSNRIIEMKLRLEQCRLMLYRGCWRHDQGQDAELDIAMSKLLISEYAVQSALDAIQTFGGAAMDQELGLVRELLNVIPSRIFSGTNDIQKEIMARKLGLRGGRG
ncbi:acyl-CoA dehydrogenase family protein [Serratia sp. JUb9]|uniref:acyl-CoA dehydrogenase family protein n=1 Tax=unclassified Serratia (in: enterobacteria) TaxID=2647522 RepID=UPI000CF6F343|nr:MULTISPECIES: acyl-CoA dehydrogenase family protein [unclassified Serratia (in: enterobacteria)]MBU3894020.1 acyl-CoA dehydrogenase family protein [Serratia rubidaea]AVJ19741.1 acyl-CoA dehydrogenase [Serratia sp. MYb239]QNK32660.1 acyl-CoA dehydrogenase family protein [Serratia sp. JUb9]QPT12944.1 acyl-CoA dehydrogenase family protein [Serratia rubidaea]SQJ31479.1 Acyl-CoA dehydrogenase, short-chain specific [Serratia rubidaea]